MNRSLVVIVLVVVLGATGWFARGWLWPDETARVKAAVTALATTLSDAGAAGGGVGLVGALTALRDQVTPDVSVEAEERGVVLSGRDELVSLVGRIGASPNRLAVTFVDVTVELDPGGTMANVSATAQVTEATATTGQQTFDAQQVDMVWTKQGQSWLLQSARAIEVLK